MGVVSSAYCAVTLRNVQSCLLFSLYTESHSERVCPSYTCIHYLLILYAVKCCKYFFPPRSNKYVLCSIGGVVSSVLYSVWCLNGSRYLSTWYLYCAANAAVPGSFMPLNLSALWCFIVFPLEDKLTFDTRHILIITIAFK